MHKKNVARQYKFVTGQKCNWAKEIVTGQKRVTKQNKCNQANKKRKQAKKEGNWARKFSQAMEVVTKRQKCYHTSKKFTRGNNTYQANKKTLS